MCIRDRCAPVHGHTRGIDPELPQMSKDEVAQRIIADTRDAVSYTHLRAHETVLDLVCRLLLEKKNQTKKKKNKRIKKNHNTNLKTNKRKTKRQIDESNVVTTYD